MNKTSRAAHRTGWIMSALVLAILFADAAINLFAPHVVAPEMAQTGWSLGKANVLGLVTLTCAIVYAIPRTAMIGAILVTGFAGGAIATHLRVDGGLTPPMVISGGIAALAWGGLYLRDARLRRLMPSVLELPARPQQGVAQEAHGGI